MGRFSFFAKAIEEQELSEAEIADIQQEATDENQQMAVESADIGRTLDIVDGITDVATIVSEGDGELSDTEMNLVRASMNMAVAGTDTDASTVIPGLESHMTRKQLVTAIEEQQYTVLQRVMQGITFLFKKLRNGWRNLISVFKSEAKLLRQTSASLAGLGDFQTEIKVKWPIAVTSEGGKVSSEHELYSNVREQMRIQQEGLNVSAGASGEAVNAYMSVVSSKFSEAAKNRAIEGYTNFATDLGNAYGASSSGSDKESRHLETGYFTCAGTLSITLPKTNGVPPSIHFGRGRPINTTTDSVPMTISASALSAELAQAMKALSRAETIWVKGHDAYDVLERVESMANSDGKGIGNAIKGIAELASSGMRISKDFVMDTSEGMDFAFWAVFYMSSHLRKIGQQVLNKA